MYIKHDKTHVVCGSTCIFVCFVLNLGRAILLPTTPSFQHLRSLDQRRKVWGNDLMLTVEPMVNGPPNKGEFMKILPNV